MAPNPILSARCAGFVSQHYIILTLECQNTKVATTLLFSQSDDVTDEWVVYEARQGIGKKGLSVPVGFRDGVLH